MDKEEQMKIWIKANELCCWRLKSTGLVDYTWVTRKEEPCIDCERPTCKSKGKSISGKDYDYKGRRTLFLDLIKTNDYVHTRYYVGERI